MPATSVENLLKAIYGLEAANNRPSTKAVADVLGVRMASVTGKVKNLAAEGLLKPVPYHGFELTAKGRKLDLRTLRRHRLIELFLMPTPGLSRDGVHLAVEGGERRGGGGAGEGSACGSVWMFTRKGQSGAAGLTANPLREKGKLTGMLCFVRDESGRKRFQQELTHLASRDSLTGLFNRRRFEEELNLEIGRSRRGEYSSAVLFLDLDHFKDVNDVLGHAAGDELLTRFSELLLSQVRETDVVARLGGDEFTVILPHTDIE